jgi:hypothetical protein
MSKVLYVVYFLLGQAGHSMPEFHDITIVVLSVNLPNTEGFLPSLLSLSPTPPLRAGGDSLSELSWSFRFCNAVCFLQLIPNRQLARKAKDSGKARQRVGRGYPSLFNLFLHAPRGQAAFSS